MTVCYFRLQSDAEEDFSSTGGRGRKGWGEQRKKHKGKREGRDANNQRSTDKAYRSDWRAKDSLSEGKLGHVQYTP